MPVDCEHSWYLAFVRCLGSQHPELQHFEPLPASVHVLSLVVVDVSGLPSVDVQEPE